MQGVLCKLCGERHFGLCKKALASVKSRVSSIEKRGVKLGTKGKAIRAKQRGRT